MTLGAVTDDQVAQLEDVVLARESDERGSEDFERTKIHEVFEKLFTTKSDGAAGAEIEDPDLQEEVYNDLARLGYTPSQIKIAILNGKRPRDYGERLEDSGERLEEPGEQLEDSGEQLVYSKIHRDHLSVETLRHYDIPYEFDPVGHIMELVVLWNQTNTNP